MEPPTSTLKNVLFQSGLCTPADIRRCRSKVRRLAKDLPTFDSIWIDALQQSRKLTAYQASCLQSGNYENLQIGPCLVLEKLGEDELGETFLTIKNHTGKKGSRQKCLVKVLNVPPNEIPQKHDQLVEYIGSLKLIPLPELSVPQAIIHRRSKIYLLSKFTEGISLRELLIRRGRFPAEIVLEIARILVSTSAKLESRRTLHGNLNLKTVQIAPDGKMILHDAGLKPVLQPIISFHTNSAASPERFSGTAPELIGTGNSRTVKTDMYALGCLCWHLLAGRSPFPSGDSMTILAKHRSCDVPDIRDRAPETPPQLARMIEKCTLYNPDERPASFQEILKEIGEPQKSGVRKLHSFRNRFDKSISSDKPFHRSIGWMKHTMMTTSLLLGLFSVAIISQPEGRQKAKTWWSESLSQIQTQFDRLKPKNISQENIDESVPTTESIINKQSSRFESLPKPNAQGVILLGEHKPYLWKNIAYNGDLVIRSKTTRPAIVVVPAESRLSAKTILFENIQFQQENEKQNDESFKSLLRLKSNTLKIQNCSFLFPNGSDSQDDFVEHAAKGKNDVSQNHRSHPHVLNWTNRGSNSHVELQNVIFSGNVSSLKIQNAPESISITNCLKTGSGRLITLMHAPNSGDQTSVEITGTTLREATNFLYCVSPNDAPGKISLVLNDCVFDLQKRKSSLIRFADLPPTQVLDWLEVTGEGTLVPASIVIADSISPGTQSLTTLPDTAILVEGILAATFRFRGISKESPSGSELATFQAPIRSSSKPGIDSTKLPQLRSNRSIKMLAN